VSSPAHALVRAGRLLFRLRSWTPVPLMLWIAARANPERRWVARGLLLTVLGLLARLWAVAHIGPKSRTRTEKTTECVVSGPYALVDHPLYAANGILSEGLLVVAGSGWPWLQILFPWIWLAQYGPIMVWEESEVNGLPTVRRERPDWAGAWKSERRTRQSAGAFLLLVFVSAVFRRLKWKVGRG